MTIDHVELFVPDRREAAAWYSEVLGLRIVQGYEQWAEDPAGPLMVSSDGGSTKLALFQGQAQGSKPTAGFHRVAFRVDADAFLRFVHRHDGEGVRDASDRQVTVASVVDHEQAYSAYFSDPYGHRLEITTYEHDAVRSRLAGADPLRG